MRHEDELRVLYELEHSGLVRTAFFICGDAATGEEVVAEAFAR